LISQSRGLGDVYKRQRLVRQGFSAVNARDLMALPVKGVYHRLAQVIAIFDDDGVQVGRRFECVLFYFSFRNSTLRVLI
jgi:hypothetical protein